MTFLSTQKITKLFRIRGGVHPDDCKTLSAEQPIETLPMPTLLHIPLQQHIGAAAKPAVVLAKPGAEPCMAAAARAETDVMLIVFTL